MSCRYREVYNTVLPGHREGNVPEEMSADVSRVPVGTAVPPG